MDSQNMTFGLIGYPLGHSWSKGHFARKFEREGLSDCRYENYEIPSIRLLETIIQQNPDLVGLNVTIPYKQVVMSYLDEIDPVALNIGAVNTIKINRTGSRCILSGYNTDAIGFSRSLEGWTLAKNTRALVFGTGGSSLAVKYTLSQLGIGYTSVSRKPGKGLIAYEAITGEMALEHLLWINCTPVGMFPDISNQLSLPFRCLTADHYLYDLIYNPEVTVFLTHGIKAGSSVMNGSRMLHEQAEASWEIWSQRPI
jgi:shikimate dehydrogenase